MADLTVEVQQRATGKNESRRLRKQGLVPAVLYGEAKEPVALSVDARMVHKILHSKMGVNTVFDIELAGKGQRRPVMIKDYQLDPVTDRLWHADFVRIDASHEVHIPVHVVLAGVPVGVKLEGGILEHPLREIMVACLPKDIPANITVDVTGLHVNQFLRVSDLELPEGVRTLTETNTVLCAVHAPKAEAAAVPGPEAVAADAAATAEAAKAAAPGAKAPAAGAKAPAAGAKAPAAGAKAPAAKPAAAPKKK
jgi:large subunit ribosomal protein L25